MLLPVTTLLLLVTSAVTASPHFITTRPLTTSLLPITTSRAITARRSNSQYYLLLPLLPITSHCQPPNLQMNRKQRYSDQSPRRGLVSMLTSGVEGLVDVTGKVGDVSIEPESGDFTAIGFSVSVAARTRGICSAFVPSRSDT